MTRAALLTEAGVGHEHLELVEVSGEPEADADMASVGHRLVTVDENLTPDRQRDGSAGWGCQSATP